MSLFNPFKLKKYGALLIASNFTVVLFFIGFVSYGMLGAIGFMMVGTLLSIIIGSVLLSNPFQQMLEGSGLLALNIDSTGVLRPFIVKLQNPYIKGKYNNKEVNDVFDRSTVYNLATPIKNTKKAQMQSDGGIKIELDEKEFNKGRFGFFHYPVLLWNDQLNTIITKDFISSKEKDSFAEHGVLYLNRKMEELTSVVRDFGRYVVELTKPATSFWKSRIFMWILIIGLILILALFAPKIWGVIQGSFGVGAKAISAQSNSIITPIT